MIESIEEKIEKYINSIVILFIISMTILFFVLVWRLIV
jgi:hypothetical protein